MKKLIFGLIVFVSIMSFSHNVFAEVIISQTDSSYSESFTNKYRAQYLGTNLTGSVSLIKMYVDNSGSPSTTLMVIYDCGTSFSTTCGYYAGSTSYLPIDEENNVIENTFISGKTLYTFDFTHSSCTGGLCPVGWVNGDTFTFNPDHHYAVVLRPNPSSGTNTTFGSSTDQSAGYCFTINGTTCDNNRDLYFEIYDEDGIPTCFDGIKNQDEDLIDVGGVCGNPDDLVYGSTFENQFINQSTGDIISNNTHIESIFGSVGYRIKGKNPYGAYDLIHIDILENDNKISDKEYAINTISNTFYNYVNTDLQALADSSTTPFTYDLGKKYTFNVLISGEYIYDDANYFNLTSTLYYGTEESFIEECGTFDLFCYFRNAVNWLFVPSAITLNKFRDLTLENSVPFSYIYDMGNLYEEIFNDTAKDINIKIAFAGEDLTLLSTDKLEAIPFQSTVRTVLGAIMIFGTAMLLYRRVIHIHDKEEIKTTV